eukprot:m.27380 g.27380  ORF g.27380 m.27380 type:complete len:95 (-) comp10238_c2_seq1:14-298(-)
MKHDIDWFLENAWPHQDIFAPLLPASEWRAALEPAIQASTIAQSITQLKHIADHIKRGPDMPVANETNQSLLLELDNAIENCMTAFANVVYGKG